MIRKVSGAVVALLVALVGMVALAGPAQAGYGKPTATFDDTCTGVQVTLANPGRSQVKFKIVAGELEPEPVLAPGDSTQVVDWPAEHGAGVTVFYKSHHGWKEIGSHDWSNPGWPGDGCAAPEAIVIEDCDGTAVATIAAGDTSRTWLVDDTETVLGFGEKAELPASSVNAEIQWQDGHLWAPLEEELITRIAIDGEQCPPPTAAPTAPPTAGPTTGPTTAPTVEPTHDPVLAASDEGLPDTGIPVLSIVAFAALLLAGGTGLVLLGRRRAAGRH